MSTEAGDMSQCFSMRSSTSEAYLARVRVRHVPRVRVRGLTLTLTSRHVPRVRHL